MSVKRLTRGALFTAAALIMFMIENLFPPLLSFAPGAKLGLSNVVSLIAMIILGIPDAFIILTVRCLLGSLLTGNVFALLYSLPSGLLSLSVQTLLYLTLFPRVSLVAVSFAGAVAHNVMQTVIASFIAGVNMLAILPLMFIAACVAGTAVGLIAYFVIKFLPKSVYMKKNGSKKNEVQL